MAGCRPAFYSSTAGLPIFPTAGAEDLGELWAHPFFDGIDWANLRSQPAPDFIAEPSLDPGKQLRCSAGICCGWVRSQLSHSSTWARSAAGAASSTASLGMWVQAHGLEIADGFQWPPSPATAPIACSPEQRQQQLRLGASEPGFGAATHFVG